MNWLDIVIIICIIIGIVNGLRKGIVKQVISLVALIAAILLSGTVAKQISLWLQPHINDGNTSNVQNTIYYILAFILIVSIFSLLAHLVDKIINFTPIGVLNRMFGALFGAFFWVLCLSMVLNVLAVFDTQSWLISQPAKENSIYYERVKMTFPTVFPYIKDFIKHETNGGRDSRSIEQIDQQSV